MLFNSIQFLLFFPAVCLLYFLLPQKARPVWLLAASYFFYMCWNVRYVVLLLLSTLLTYGAAWAIDRCRRRGWRRFWLAFGLVSNLAILFFFKYVNFLLETLAGLAAAVGVTLAMPRLDVLLPVGISFYTFQALSYTLDVYRGAIQRERSFLYYALYVSFFPQLVAGPIERSGALLPQLRQPQPFDPDRVRDGLLLMLWGFFEKLVIADRAAVLVDAVFSDPDSCGGVGRVLAAVLFCVQLYCDFGGYSHIAIGAAQVLGVRLSANFRQPYLACSIDDFWRRWHISLTRWFTDYLYIPLGGSRRGQLRTCCNLLAVFFVSGLWHGAAWHFVAWGLLHGLYKIAARLTRPPRRALYARLHWNTGSFAWRLGQRVTTFALVCVAFVFFRAQTVRQALSFLAGIPGRWDPWMLVDGTLFRLGLNGWELAVLLGALLVLLAVDAARERGLPLRRMVTAQPLPLRWLVYYAAVLSLLVFGIWGPQYDAAAFLYFQF